MIIRFVSRVARKGVDPHPSTHTAAALDTNGKALAYFKVDNTEAGLQKLRSWAEQFSERVWAIEGANNPFITPLSYALTERDNVVNISPNLTSQYRELAPTASGSGPRDAGFARSRAGGGARRTTR